MSRALDLMDILPALLAGGYVSEAVEPLRKPVYTVHAPGIGLSPARSVGHITEGMCGKLRRRGLLRFTECRDYKGGFVNFFLLSIPNAQASTNAARIRAMTDDELADFLHEVGVAEPPWDKAFSRTFCNSCKACEQTIDLIDCPHGRPVDWWLKQAAKLDAAAMRKELHNG